MRDLTPAEMLSIREFLTMETTNLASMKMMNSLIKDEKLKAACEGGIEAAEGRVKGLQQFIQENGIMSIEGGQQ